MVAAAWSGRIVESARKYMTRFLPTPCAKCGQEVGVGDAWVVGHKHDRALHPELIMVPRNWQIECRPCSDASGQAVVIEKAKRDALRSVGIEVQHPEDDHDFSRPDTPRKPPPFPISLSPGLVQSPEIADRLTWSNGVLSRFEWLRPFLDVPEDAAVPLAMTPPDTDATGSYGAEAIRWIEETQGIRLRWWQRLAITRQLEHRADGSLVWRTMVESCPRRAGKSVRIRGMALWRMAHAELIGEVQTVIHCGNDLPICREIQRGAWRWAESQRWKVSVANGKESIEAPDGSRWLVRSQEGTYGFDAGLAVVDESWDVKPETVSEGLEPAMLERCWAQLHLTSTAHRRATSLMKTRITAALTAEDGETLLLLWAASAGSDPSEERTWRAASPHWSEDRRRMIAAKYENALAGQSDPEADDLDPMAGFLAQYLNVWQLGSKRRERGNPVVSEDDWRALTASPGMGEPDAVAVEGYPGEGVSVARCWRTGATVVVAVAEVSDLASAAALVRSYGSRRPALVGSSLASDPAWHGMRVKPASGQTGVVVADLARLLGDGVVRHDGGEHLSAQALRVRTLPGTNGLRMYSTGRADAVKAAVWAVQDVRTTQSLGKPRILIAAP